MLIVARKMHKTKLIMVAFIILFAIIIYFNFSYLFDYKSIKNAVISFGNYGYILFLVIFVVAAIFSIHGSILAIVAGILFGPMMGGVLTAIGSALGAMAAFLLARYLLRDYVEEKFSSNTIYQKIQNGIKKDGTSFLIITRLVIIFPYNVQNFIYGLTEINFKKYSIISFITMIPGSFLYTYLAHELVSNGFKLSLESTIYVFIASVFLAMIAIIPKKIYEKREAN